MDHTLGRGFAALILATPLVGVVTVAPPAGAAPCTVTGTAGNDVLTGTAGPDVLCGLGGNDVLRGLRGDDELVGGDGNDTLLPGPGSNEVHGDTGTDTLRYDDLSTGSVQVNLSLQTVTGAVTDAVLTVENVVGTYRNDRLVGSPGPNRLDGRAGNDIVVGRDGADRLLGADGIDALTPGHGNDVADGGGGVDTLSYRDIASGVVVDLRFDTVVGDAGSDTVTALENVVGSQGDDELYGDRFANRIQGLGGDDVIHPVIGGKKRVSGGDGLDTLDFSDYGTTSSGVSSGATVNLQLGTLAVPGNNAGTVDGVEDVIGSRFRDVLIGDSGANWLEGEGGHDTIEGGAGDDTMYGAAGSDTFLAGAGYDYVVGGESADVDWINYVAETGPISAELDDEVVDTDEGTFDTVIGIETLRGTTFDDHLYGGLGATNVTLIGEGGTDDMNTTDGFAGDGIQGDPSSSCSGDPGDTISC